MRASSLLGADLLSQSGEFSLIQQFTISLGESSVVLIPPRQHLGTWSGPTVVLLWPEWPESRVVRIYNILKCLLRVGDLVYPPVHSRYGVSDSRTIRAL